MKNMVDRTWSAFEHFVLFHRVTAAKKKKGKQGPSENFVWDTMDSFGLSLRARNPPSSSSRRHTGT